MSVPIFSEMSRNSGQKGRDEGRGTRRDPLKGVPLSGVPMSRFSRPDVCPVPCPDLPMRCLETRRRDGMRWRRYRTADGVTLATYEVPVEVLRVLGEARLRKELERAARTLERKTRNARALKLLQAGWKVEAVANDVGLCDSQVRRIRQRMKA